MTLLEVVSNATANRQPLASGSDYPIILNSDGIFSVLKPKYDSPNPSSLVNRVSGWDISKTDAELVDSCKKFFTKLKRKLKDTNNFNRDDFIGMLKPFLKKIAENFEISVGIDSSSDGYVRDLIEKTGFLMGRDLGALVLEGCVGLEIWEIVETLIANGLVDHSAYSNLVSSLVEKKRSDLLCLFIKHVSDLGASELLSILKYFLCPCKDALNSMVKVREEWDNQALLAIEKASDKNLSSKKSRIAKEAAILLMIAHDGFSVSELCLHFLLASRNFDDVVLASAISKLSGKDMANLIGYLVKWLKKYERFPQAGPCMKAASTFGLKLCDWVPKLEDVAKCLGLVIEENFSSLVLNPEFHEELKCLEGVVGSLASESKLCCFMANVVDKLRLGSGQN